MLGYQGKSGCGRVCVGIVGAAHCFDLALHSASLYFLHLNYIAKALAKLTLLSFDRVFIISCNKSCY